MRRSGRLGDGVRGRHDRADLVAAVGVGQDLAAQDALGQRRVEARVQALRVGVPHVELGAPQRFAVLAGDAPGEHDRIAFLVVTDGAAGTAPRAAARPAGGTGRGSAPCVPRRFSKTCD